MTSTEGQKPIKERLKTYATIVLGWLGLNGLADGYISWKNWFEAGVMEHWRAVKEAIASLLPFDIPLWTFDMLAIIAFVVRTVLLTRSELNKDEREPLTAVLVLAPLAAVFFIFFIVDDTGWNGEAHAPPAMLIAFAASTMWSVVMEARSKRTIRRFLAHTGSTLILFIVTLFVASDFLTKLF